MSIRDNALPVPTVDFLEVLFTVVAVTGYRTRSCPLTAYTLIEKTDTKTINIKINAPYSI